MKNILRNTRKLVAMLLMAVLVVGLIPTTTFANNPDTRLQWTLEARFVYAESDAVLYIADTSAYVLLCDGRFTVITTLNGEYVDTSIWHMFNSPVSGFVYTTPGAYVFTFIPPEGWTFAPDQSPSITLNWDGRADFRDHAIWYLVPGTSAPTAPNLNTASTWAHEGITNAVANNLVPAALQNHYTQPATRAEFTSLAVALYEAATGRTITGRVQFTDTTDVNVQKMAYLGVVTGVGNNRFDPTGQITREQAAVMLSRLATAIGQPFPNQPPTFADIASLSAWAVEGVGQAQAAGVMSGVGDNRFAPRDTFTREQSIITILRMFDMLD